ncbi:MAG: ABC transporter ATP-binding protein/permease [Lactobacillales bacterium]|jgi:ATP-binding cassette subfamily B protein|nr:ABC transporter ATP-binding protein/permease [Lactobacillales bacterium]
MSLFKDLWWFFKLNKRTYLIAIVSLLAIDIASMVPPRILGALVDMFAKKHFDMSLVYKFGIGVAVVAVLTYAMRYIWRVLLWGNANKLEKMLRLDLFKHLLKMDSNFYQKYRTGDLMTHVITDIGAVGNGASRGVLMLADSILQGGVVLISMCLVVNPKLCFFALLPFPILVGGAFFLGKKMQKAYKGYQKSLSEIGEKAQESVSSVKVIRTFGQEKEDAESFEKISWNAKRKFDKVAIFEGCYDLMFTSVKNLCYVMVIIVGGILVTRHTLTIGGVVTFMNYIVLMLWPMFALGQIFNVTSQGRVSYARLRTLFDEISEIEDDAPDAIQTIGGELTVDVKKFRYLDDEDHGVDDINFTIKPGGTLGIVGRTGSGKSTVARLLMREFDTYEGTLKFGANDYRDIALGALQGSIGYVPQDHFLFSVPIRENIAFGLPEMTQEQIEHYAKIANVHDDIKNFPEGYETVVGERGVSLSGGQKQRVSIARALAIEPRMLIFDDALSAVDAKTENSILGNIKEDFAEDITVIIAHRLSSVMHADEIIVLDHGRITERGTHAELLANRGWYEEMWRNQKIESEF